LRCILGGENDQRGTRGRSSVAMENVLDRYAEAHSVDRASTNITMLSALFMALADVFNRAIKDGNLPVCLQHAETAFAQLITLLRPMARGYRAVTHRGRASR